MKYCHETFGSFSKDLKSFLKNFVLSCQLILDLLLLFVGTFQREYEIVIRYVTISNGTTQEGNL